MDWLQSLKDTMMGKVPGVDASEKRRCYRVSCSLPVVVQITPRDALSGRLTNLSTTGLKLRFPRPLKPGVDYTMRVRGKLSASADTPQRELAVQGRCIWCRRSVQGEGYDVGCLFTGFIGVHMSQVLDFFREELQIDIEDSDQKRGTTRVAKRFHVTFTGEDGKVANGFVRNLSLTGIQIASRAPVETGSNLNITVDFGDRNEKMHTTVQVVRCRKMTDEDWHEVGGTFKNLNERDQQRLGMLVSTFMKEAWAEG